MEDDSPAPTAVSSRAVVRAGWLVCGLACVALGSVGIVVPGLPTTIFFIAAAASFTRSSPRLEAWVLGLPKIGPAVRDYRAGLGMPKRAKIAAIAMIVLSVSRSVVLVDNTAIRVAIAAVGAIGVGYVWRVPVRVDQRVT
ncbi:MAG: YbaN family protein [Ilumatobacter sp.]